VAPLGRWSARSRRRRPTTGAGPRPTGPDTSQLPWSAEPEEEVVAAAAVMVVVVVVVELEVMMEVMEVPLVVVAASGRGSPQRWTTHQG